MHGLYRIISGVIRTNHLVVMPPSLLVLEEAEYFYNKTFEEAYSSGCYTENSLSRLIIENNILPEDYKVQLDVLRSSLENFKVNYFLDYSKPSSREKTKKNIEDIEYSIIYIKNKIYRYNQLTCSGIADFAKNLFILERCTFKDDKPYDFGDISLVNLQSYIDSLILDDEELRDLSISEEWRSLWNIRSETPVFSCKAYELTQEQKSLIYWSKLYDSIYESPDRPSDLIIKDHYAVDGWLIHQRRESDKEKKGEDRHGNADEVYHIVRSQEDLEYVKSLNSSQSLSHKEKVFKKGT